MFPFKQDLSAQQKNYSKWVVNTVEYIIIHHTATPAGTLQGCINWLLGKTSTSNPVSCHFIVDVDGSAYKLGDPKQVLWHAGQSLWGMTVGLNYHSVGIEIIWPTDWDFTNEQRGTVKALIGHLMATFKIPAENVLRHADLTWSGSGKKTLWDGKSKSRKTDVDHALWKNFPSWDAYRKSIEVKAL